MPAEMSRAQGPGQNLIVDIIVARVRVNLGKALKGRIKQRLRKLSREGNSWTRPNRPLRLGGASGKLVVQSSIQHRLPWYKAPELLYCVRSAPMLPVAHGLWPVPPILDGWNARDP
jgi:hypothetical protein